MSSKNTTAREELMEQMQYLGQMMSTETALFHQLAATKLGLGVTDMKVLSLLTQEGSMTAGSISKRVYLTTGAVTNIIDRLEKRQLVAREHDGTDRRKVIVVARREQLHPVDDMYASIGTAFDALLSEYSEDEIKLLAKFYEQSIELTQQEIQKLQSR